MSSQKTEHYQLHQWQPQDQVLREEFNQNFTKIDAVVGGLLATGVYAGDDKIDRTIELPFTPSAILVIQSYPYLCDTYTVRGGLAVQGSPVLSNTVECVTIVEKGFVVHNLYQDGYAARTNCRNYYYHYIAVA